MEPSGPKARPSGVSSQAPLLPFLFFAGLEESATQTSGQFGSPQGGLGKLLRCQPCPEGCTSCLDATPCLVEEALALRTAVLACQACCMLAVFLSMLVAYRCRGSKARRPRISLSLSPVHTHRTHLNQRTKAWGDECQSSFFPSECVTSLS